MIPMRIHEMGGAELKLKLIKVIASIWYRYSNFATIALNENSTAASAAKLKPIH